MSYFENFLKANQAYVELHGDLHLSIKPKTKVAIVTCMELRQLLGWLWEMLIFCGMQVVE